MPSFLTRCGSGPENRLQGFELSRPPGRERPGHVTVADSFGISPYDLRTAPRWTFYEEYHPYGTTAYRAASSAIDVSARRYRYTGKERDEETGLYYHGARYYAPWLGRWTSSDPAGIGADGPGLYTYCRGNPIGRTDPTGREGKDAEPEKKRRPMPDINAVHNPFQVGNGKEGLEAVDAIKVPKTFPVDQTPMPKLEQGSATRSPGPRRMTFGDYNKIVDAERFTPGYGVGASVAIAGGETDPTQIDKAGEIAAGVSRMVPVARAIQASMVASGPRSAAPPEPPGSKAQGSGGQPPAASAPSEATQAPTQPVSPIPTVTPPAPRPSVYIPRDASGNPIPLRTHVVKGTDIPLPLQEAQGPHTVLGGKVSGQTGETYRQSATFPNLQPTVNGKPLPWSRVDWGTHGRADHANPHHHVFTWDPVQQKWSAGPPRPFGGHVF